MEILLRDLECINPHAKSTHEGPMVAEPAARMQGVDDDEIIAVGTLGVTRERILTHPSIIPDILDLVARLNRMFDVQLWRSQVCLRDT